MTGPIDLCERVLELVNGRADAQVLASTGVAALTRFANSFIHQNVAEDTAYLSLAVARDARLATVSTTRVDDASLGRVVEAALDAAALRPADPNYPGLTPPTPIPHVDHFDQATADASPADRADHVRAFVDAGEGLDAAGYCATTTHQYAFANSAGQHATGRATVASFEGIQQLVPGVAAGLATQAGVALSELDGGAAGRTAAATARAAADPIDLDPGDYEVVLQPECLATILVFLGYDSFNAKTYEQGQSCVRLGEQQFDAVVQIKDDALDPRATGAGYDGEGTPKRTVDLVRDGVSTALVHDRRTARKAGVESTGHGGPGSDTWGPVPGNLFMSGGSATVDELVAGVERGLLVSELNYCRVLDSKTMVLTGITRNGTFLIENGAIVRPVKNLRFTQSFLDALGPGNVRGLSVARYAASNEEEVIHAPGAHLARWHFTGGAKG